MQLLVASSTMKRIAIILVVWSLASAMGGTIKDKTKPTLNPAASAVDPAQEIKRLRTEILELRNEQQATTEVPKVE